MPPKVGGSASPRTKGSDAASRDDSVQQAPVQGRLTTASSLVPAPLKDAPDPELVARQHHANLVVSSFANLELTSMQQTLKQYQQMYEEVRKENTRLADTLKTQDKDYMVVVERLHEDLTGRSRDVKALEEQLKTVKETLREEHAAELAYLKETVKDRDQKIEQLKITRDRLQNDLDGLAEFRRTKQEVEAATKKQLDEHHDTVLKYQKEIAKMKFDSLEEKMKLRAVEKAMVERFDEEVQQRAGSQVDAEAKAIRDQNGALLKDKGMLEKEINYLTKVSRDTQAQLSDVRREADLALQGQAEYAKHGCKLTRQARDSAAKVKELEAALTLAKKQNDGRIRDVATLAKSREETLEHDLEVANRALLAHREELVAVRSMASRIVNQRSDLEKFFYEALDHVRCERKNQLLAIQQSEEEQRQRADPQFRRHGPPVGMQGALSKVTTGSEDGPVLEVLATRTKKGHQGELDHRPAPPLAGSTVDPRRAGPRSFGGDKTPRGHGTFMTQEGEIGQLTAIQQPNTARVSRMVPMSNPNATRHGRRVNAMITQQQQVVAQLSQNDQPDFSLPPVRQSSQQDTLPAPSNDFSALSWHDKERIICALLFHVNQKFYGPPPPQTAPSPLRNQNTGENVDEFGMPEPTNLDTPQEVEHVRASAFPSSRPPSNTTASGNRQVPPLGRPPTGESAGRPSTRGMAGVDLRTPLRQGSGGGLRSSTQSTPTSSSVQPRDGSAGVLASALKGSKPGSASSSGTATAARRAQFAEDPDVE